MITGRDNLKNWMRSNNALFWKIKHVSNTAHVYGQHSKEGGTIEESIEVMDQHLNWLATGRYHIESSEKDFSEKSATKQRYNIPYDHVNGNVGAISGPAIMQPQVDVQAEILKALEKYKKEQEAEQMKKELAELKKQVKEKDKTISGLEKMDPFRRIAQRFMPVAEVLLEKNGFKLGPEEDATIGEVKTEKMSAEEYTERLEKAFEAWDETDEKTKLIIIEKIAKMSKDDKAKYGMARGILLKSNS